MKIRCEYSVSPELKFLSNLDMMHMMERALRRADIPYALTEGFNPHIKLSMGTVLPVGLWGEREYFDLELTKEVSIDWFIKQMDSVLPEHINIMRAIENNSQESLMKTINAACYSYKIIGLSESEVKQIINNMMNKSELTIASRGKKKNVEKNLKPGIYEIEVKEQNDSVIIDLTVAVGEPVNIRFDELKDVLLQAGIKESNLADIYRKSNLIKKSANYYTPLEKVV
ncbi:MAG: DUF2344 domain-containing protein [Syntrophomonadaceae bacterium]|nr:DUF2344 domain-containing protein [Syntrophomonadaceae bacterium]